MLLRVRWSGGTFRVELPEGATLDQLVAKVEQEVNVPRFLLSLQPNGAQNLPVEKRGAPLHSFGLKHGDMVFLQSLTGKEEVEEPQEETKPVVIEEDEVDQVLEKQDGWIQRNRDPQVCKHGTHGRCTYCMPVAPWEIINLDPWKKDGVRFIPFHSYLRKRQGLGAVTQTLEEPSYKISSKLPTSAKLTCRLDSQVYRHVDHMEMERLDIVNTFIQAWRETGNQRCGYLYGKYVPAPHIPLGIKASVSAIYEPPQKNTRTGVELLDDPDAELVDITAAKMGLSRVGFIWTDLQADPSGKPKVTREFGDALLSSSEVIRMARMQNLHPSPCKASTTGKLGSKFISALVTGNAAGEIELQVYQVSDQCMALVRDGAITSSRDPKHLKVRKSTKRIVPDIMYATKDSYGNEVVEKAEPMLPLDFFIVKMSHGAPLDPNPLFKLVKFPVENRGPSQSLEVVKTHFQTVGSLADKLADFHLLLYLAKQIPQVHMEKLIHVVLKKAKEAEAQPILEDLLKNVVTRSQHPEPSAPVRPSTGNAKEAEWIQQLQMMGFNATQAKEALWATSYQGIEAAIDFLSK